MSVPSEKFDWSSRVGETDATEALIEVVFSPTIYKKVTDRVTSKKKVFDEVANILKQRGYNLPWRDIPGNKDTPGHKVHEKYRNLIMIYKKYILKLQQTGAAPVKAPKYMDLLHPHLSKRHDVQPRYLEDSLSTSPILSPNPSPSPISSSPFQFPPSPISPSPYSPSPISPPPPVSSPISPPVSSSPISPPVCEPSTSSSRHNLVKKTLKPKTGGAEVLFQQFRIDEADRRKQELAAFEKATAKDQEQRKEFLTLFKTFVTQTNEKKRKKKKKRKISSSSSSSGSSSSGDFETMLAKRTNK